MSHYRNNSGILLEIPISAEGLECYRRGLLLSDTAVALQLLVKAIRIELSRQGLCIGLLTNASIYRPGVDKR